MLFVHGFVHGPWIKPLFPSPRRCLACDLCRRERPADQLGQRGRHLGVRLQVGLDVLLHGERDIGLTDAPAERLQGGAYGAASDALRAGLRPWRGSARRGRAVPAGRVADLEGSLAVQAAAGTAVFLAPHCPARGHRVQGGPAGRRMRSAAPTPDPVTTHLGFGSCEEDGEEGGPAGQNRTPSG